MNFEWRKLFPISWYRWSKGHDFNSFVFYLDMTLWVILILTIMGVLIANT